MIVKEFYAKTVYPYIYIYLTYDNNKRTSIRANIENLKLASALSNLTNDLIDKEIGNTI